MSPPTKGMLSQRAARKSLMGTLVDLYKTDLAFRGMTDFAVIGFVTMMFLHPPSAIRWSRWDDVKPAPGQDVVEPRDDTAKPKIAVPISFPLTIKNARLSDAFVFDFDTAAFKGSSAEDQPRLVAARLAVALGDTDKALQELAGASDSDPSVALLRGAAETQRYTEAGNRAAEAYWRKAVSGGSVQAKALLGQLLAGLPGVTANAAEARQLIEAGVDLGDPQALRLAGTAYLSGELGTLDPVRAAELLKRSADAGDAMAMAVYARVLADGLGLSKPDPKAAADYLEKAANAGLTSAQYSLGQWMIEQFMNGARPDPKPGIAWLERAYEKGRALSGLTGIAAFYEGAPQGWKNITLAAEYVRRCSALPYCQIFVGYAWKEGYFGSVDLVAARAHSAVAARTNPNAAAQLREIDAKLTPEQRAEAAALEQRIMAGLATEPAEVRLQLPDQPALPRLEAIWPSIPPVGTLPPSADAGPSNGGDAETVALRERVGRHMQEKDYDSALADLTDIIRRGDAGWEDYYQRGMTHEAKGQAQLALEDYDRAIARNPKAANVYFSRAFVRLDQDEAGALADATTAIALDPGTRLYYLGRGNIHFRKGDYRAAIADYDKFVDMLQTADAETKAVGYYVRGKAKVQLALAEGDTCQAMLPPPPSCSPATKFQAGLSDLEQSLALNSNDADVNFLIGLIADKSGEKRRAIDYYTYALKSNPTLTSAYNNRGVIYADMGQKDLAMEDYNAAIRSDAQNASAWANRGILFTYYRNRKQAIADLRQALAIDPNLQYARENLRRLGARP